MFKKLAKHPGTGYGIVSDIVTLSEYAGTSFLAGYVQNAYPGKARIKGVPADLAVGVGFKALSLIATLAGVHGKVGAVRSHVDTIGNALIGSYAHAMGSGVGFTKSGRVRAFLPAASVDKLRKAVPESTIFGVAAKAPQGDYLSTADLQHMATR